VIASLTGQPSGLYWAFAVMTWRSALVLGRQWPGLQLPLVIVSAVACFLGGKLVAIKDKNPVKQSAVTATTPRLTAPRTSNSPNARSMIFSGDETLKPA
jgi:hypothetical protein